MKIPLVGPTRQQRSLPFDAQRTLNLYPVSDESGKEVSALYGTPGLRLFGTAALGPHRGAFKSGNERVFFVSGSLLCEIESDGTVTQHGSLLTSTGKVSICEGTTQLAICDGQYLYSFVYDTNALTQVTDPDLPSIVAYVTNIDGYFVISVGNEGTFYISSINDLSNWDVLDFATAESDPDYLSAPIKAIGQLWLMGKKVTEVWTNSGASDFPFRRISGGVIKAGILAPHSALEIDNTLVWVGQDEFGLGIVYRANGFTPQSISDEAIEKKIQECSSPTEIYAWAYQEDGHLHYVLTGGGLETSLVYDFKTQQWHERSYLNAAGEHEQHLGACHVFAFNKHLIGDRRNGKIYEMDLDIYSDDGDEISRERIYTHISDENKPIRFNALEICLENGVGLQSGQGSDPLISLEVSKDGGRTWSTPQYKSFGAVGEYRETVAYRRFGVADTMTFRVKITDPVKVALIGSYLR